MDFYYPNRTNDFWPMMGLIFFGDRDWFYDRGAKQFRVEQIKEFLEEKGDSSQRHGGHKARRLKGNASDKFLEIVEPVPLRGVACADASLPHAGHHRREGGRGVGVAYRNRASADGEMTRSADGLSKSGACLHEPGIPLRLEKKAEYYARMFRHAGLLPPKNCIIKDFS